MSKYLRNFNQICQSDVDLVGGKGASLGEMTKAGISVPPGFVITSDVFEDFLNCASINTEIATILDSINYKKNSDLVNASEKIIKLILGASISPSIEKSIQKYYKKLDCKFVAVRSSATAEDSTTNTWAGQLESHLNTSEENLLKNIKKCWASLYTPRAIFYRFEKKLLKKKISVAVIVQKMIDSDKSGVAFSVHPVTGDSRQMIIEAAYGLGEAIVSGQITPDSYIVEKQPIQIINKDIQTQLRGLYRAEKGGNEWREIFSEKADRQVLSYKEIIDLSNIIVKIETHYGFPCDVEWAVKNGIVYIIQSRPITTITETDNNKISLADGLLELLGDKKLIRADVDYIPFLAMIDWLNYYDVNGNLKNVYPASFYFSKNRTVVFLSQSYAECSKEIFDNLVSGEIQAKDISVAYNKSASKIIRNYSKYFLDDCLANESEKILLQKFKTIYKTLRELVARTLFIEQMDETIVKKVLEKHQTKNIDDVLAIVKLQHFLSFEARNTQAILDVIDDKKPLNYLYYAFLNYTFVPDEAYLKQVIIQSDPEKLRLELLQAKDNLQKSQNEYKEKLQKQSESIQRIIEILSWTMQTRDKRRDIINMSEAILYKMAERLFQIWGLEKSLVKLTGAIEILGGKEKILADHQEIKKRVSGFGILYKPNHSYELRTGTFVSDIRELDQVILDQNKTRNNMIRGEIGNKGKIVGKVRVILKSSQFNDFKEGEILVTGITGPEFVPLMKKSSAIITDGGGITSHAAIISREFNKPCIVRTIVATQILKNGDKVEVNANSGVVRIIERT